MAAHRRRRKRLAGAGAGGEAASEEGSQGELVGFAKGRRQIAVDIEDLEQIAAAIHTRYEFRLSAGSAQAMCPGNWRTSSTRWARPGTRRRRPPGQRNRQYR